MNDLNDAVRRWNEPRKKKRASVESLFGHMDRADRERLSTAIRQEAAFGLRAAEAVGRSGKHTQREVDNGLAYMRRRAAQYVAVADWIEND